MHDNDGVSKSVKTTTNPATLVLKVMLVLAFSLASWFIWDRAFQELDGVCAGPICIHQGDDTIE